MLLHETIKFRGGTPNCPNCKGVGYFLEEFVRGFRTEALVLCSCVSTSCDSCPSKGKEPFQRYDYDNEELTLCPCVPARNSKKHLEAMIEGAQIPPKYRYKFLHNLKDREASDDPNDTFISAQDFINQLIKEWNNPNEAHRGFYLTGGTGSGKTLLACVILNELIFRYGVKCRYAKIQYDFISKVLGSYRNETSEASEQSIKAELADVDVLVLDDFGIQKDSEFNNRLLYDLIDRRYEQDKITLITSNSSLDEFKTWGEGRIYSRLKEMTTELALKCTDFRQKIQTF